MGREALPGTGDRVQPRTPAADRPASTALRACSTAWEAAPTCAAYLPLSGLPRLHGTRIENIPADIPYLRPDPARRAT